MGKKKCIGRFMPRAYYYQLIYYNFKKPIIYFKCCNYNNSIVLTSYKL